MYPNQQLGQQASPSEIKAVTATGFTIGPRTDIDPPKVGEGVGSALARLQESIAENLNLTENLRSSLGISIPCDRASSDTGSGMVDYINRMHAAIREANLNLASSLEYLNS